jgi:hypothetical protein
MKDMDCSHYAEEFWMRIEDLTVGPRLIFPEIGKLSLKSAFLKSDRHAPDPQRITRH